MSFWGKIFGTEKALNGVVDGVTKGLDALVYTDEEKAADAAQNRTEARRMVVDWMAATQGQNLARRLIALSVTGVWLLQYLAGQAAGLAALWVDDPARLRETAEFLRSGAGDMGSPVMLILAFYFAAPNMGDITKAVLGRFSKNVTKG